MLINWQPAVFGAKHDVVCGFKRESTRFPSRQRQPSRTFQDDLTWTHSRQRPTDSPPLRSREITACCRCASAQEAPRSTSFRREIRHIAISHFVRIQAARALVMRARRASRPLCSASSHAALDARSISPLAAPKCSCALPPINVADAAVSADPGRCRSIALDDHNLARTSLRRPSVSSDRSDPPVLVTILRERPERASAAMLREHQQQRQQRIGREEILKPA